MSRFYLSVTLLIAFTFFGASPTFGQYVPDPNTVGLKHLDEASEDSVSDASGNGNHGIAYRTTIVPGKFGFARRFFPGMIGHIAVPDSQSLRVTDELTIEAWINTPNADQDFVIVSKACAGAPFSYSLAYSRPDRRFVFGIASSGSQPTLVYSNQVVINTGEWIHIAGVYKPTSYMTIFVNGREHATRLTNNDVPPSIQVTTARLVIGAADCGGLGVSGLFDGAIDDVRVSNKERSAEELAPSFLCHTFARKRR